MEKLVEVSCAIDNRISERVAFAVHAVEERRDGISDHVGEYKSCGTCAVAFVRFEHGRFGAQFFLEVLNFIECVNDGDVFFAELIDPFFVLRKVDAVYGLVGILLGNDEEFVWNGNDDKLDAACFERVLESDDLLGVVAPASGCVQQALLQEQPAVLAFDNA